MVVNQVFDFTLNDSSLFGMFQKINSFTDVGGGGMLGIFILLVVGGVLFMMMKAYGNEKAFSVSMMITALVGAFLRILNLVSDTIMYICILIFAVGFLLMMKEGEKYD